MESKMIAGIKPLWQFMEDGSMLMPDMPAVYRLIQSLGAPEEVNYDYILSLSGAAVRLTWQPGWAGYEEEPNQGTSFIDGNQLVEFQTVFPRLGVTYRTCLLRDKKSKWDGNFEGEVCWRTGQEAKEDICASIDRGVPVILKNDRYVCTLVIGYDQEGKRLAGLSVFAPKEEEVLPEHVVWMENWEQDAEGYFLTAAYQPRDMDKKLLCEVMQTAVNLARREKIEKYGDAALGLAAFDALALHLVWDESFESLELGKTYPGKICWPFDRPEGYYREDGARRLDTRFWNGYCDFLCMLNGYDNFARFLLKQADSGIAPRWADKLREIASYYQAACDYSGKLWDYVTPDEKGVEKFKEKEVRYIFAAHMLRAKIYTQKAVEALEKLLSKL